MTLQTTFFVLRTSEGFDPILVSSFRFSFFLSFSELFSSCRFLSFLILSTYSFYIRDGNKIKSEEGREKKKREDEDGWRAEDIWSGWTNFFEREKKKKGKVRWRRKEWRRRRILWQEFCQENPPFVRTEPQKSDGVNRERNSSPSFSLVSFSLFSSFSLEMEEIITKEEGKNDKNIVLDFLLDHFLLSLSSLFLFFLFHESTNIILILKPRDTFLLMSFFLFQRKWERERREKTIQCPFFFFFSIE